MLYIQRNHILSYNIWYPTVPWCPIATPWRRPSRSRRPRKATSAGTPRRGVGTMGQWDGMSWNLWKNMEKPLENGDLVLVFMGFYRDFMGFCSDLMGCYSDWMRFYSDFAGFYSESMAFYSDLMEFYNGLMGCYSSGNLTQLWKITIIWCENDSAMFNSHVQLPEGVEFYLNPMRIHQHSYFRFFNVQIELWFEPSINYSDLN